MNDPLVSKVEQLFKEGKITEEEKEKLIESLLEDSKKEFSSIVLNLRTTDVEIVGKENIEKVAIEGSPLRSTIKENKLILEDSLLKSGGKSVIYVPYNKNLFIRGVSSDIKIENMAAHIEIQTVSSNIVLKNVSYGCVISGISSDVILESFSGTVSLNTKTGNIRILKSKISAFLKTYSGDLDVTDSILKDSRVSTFNGDIRFERCGFEGKNAASTHFGDVLLRAIDKDNLTINAKTSLGEVKGDYNVRSNSQNMLEVETKFGDVRLEDKNEA
ncbi:MAG: DUF4097 family beta strand repeat protein [Candidatus Atribacteria bacterium]|nr:DUF4097 family beta strand repeat protein [Candidatus Atribacteria bacterium]